MEIKYCIVTKIPIYNIFSKVIILVWNCHSTVIKAQLPVPRVKIKYAQYANSLSEYKILRVYTGAGDLRGVAVLSRAGTRAQSPGAVYGPAVGTKSCHTRGKRGLLEIPLFFPRLFDLFRDCTVSQMLLKIIHLWQTHHFQQATILPDSSSFSSSWYSYRRSAITRTTSLGLLQLGTIMQVSSQVFYSMKY